MSRVLHLRTATVLGPDDQRDLDDFFAQLRAYYDIPPDRPVFPPRRTGRAQPRGDRRPTRTTARNRADHPWRNTL
jgi:hypothetical protein